MRLRLLRRRLTVSSPRLAIRSTLPWPVRWLLAAVVLGFSAAIGLWAFEFGKGIAGVQGHANEELRQLRQDVIVLRQELSEARSVANTAESLLTAEKVAQEQLMLHLRQAQTDNQALRNDLGFFERLIPGTGGDSLSIRGLQVQALTDTQLQWQVLMIQARKNAPDFQGVLELTVHGTLGGQPWQASMSPRPVAVQRYLRQEGLMDLPAGAVVKTVTARLRQGAHVRSEHTVKL
ncbi:MAG: DUF6776 family protein [Gammaproteobacteria bacterium]